MFSLLKNKKQNKLSNCLPKWLCHLFCSPTSDACKLLLLYILSACSIVRVLEFSHFSRCGVVCCFNSRFPTGMWSGAPFHMLTCHLYIFLKGRCLFRSFPQFLIGLFIFSLVSFKSSLHILNVSPQWDMCFAPGGLLLLAFLTTERRLTFWTRPVSHMQQKLRN